MRRIHGVYLRKDALINTRALGSARWPTSTIAMSLVRRCRPDCAQYRQIRSSSTLVRLLMPPPPSWTANREILTARFDSGRNPLHQWTSQSTCGRLRGNRVPSSTKAKTTTTTATMRQYSTTSSSPIPNDISSSACSSTQAIASPRSPLTIDPTAAHHDLTSFLTYAQRSGLSTSSTVYNGTLYEYLAQDTLRRYGFELHRVGGRGDRGVDLVGVWAIPKKKKRGGDEGADVATKRGREYAHTTCNGTGNDGGSSSHEMLRVLVQCKRLVGKGAKIGPNLIRELDGAVRGARLGFLFDSLAPRGHTTACGNTTSSTTTNATARGSAGNTAVDTDADTDADADANADTSISQDSSNYDGGNPAIGVLVGTRPATKGVIESLQRSNRGLVWIMLEEVAANVNSNWPAPRGGDGEAEIETEGATTATQTISSSSISQAGNEEAHQRRRQEKPKSNRHRDPTAYADQQINIETDLEHFQIVSPPSSSSASSGSSTTTGVPNPMPLPLPTPNPPLKGRIKQIIWNQAARNLGLEDIDVVKRYITLSPSSAPSNRARGRGRGRGASNGVYANKAETPPEEEEEEVVLSRAGRVILG
ncbi:uncharacterized protein A1O9_05683 [Exophiala aquamarina CBS 119918]|uniref:Required for respiratory growth protein 7, mitochondrial n=1 Tax=Exophiala aquamarina CBS 119918 TaxID=1182545 RepID=A0A072PEV4_9EURO|nr:uncharacterized protein A1O9_05683 [Exophiala aquamarina CBS 119918]KEF57763.1 hypothetical protein A1O9_05683 [Exophiala aquamarina CBS 119918]